MRSRLLVLGQFASIAVLVFGGDRALPWWAWSIFGVGLAVFAWAAASLGGNNFTILPDPRKGNTLSVQGIYHFLRHPMYTAVVLCGIAVSFGAPSLARWMALTVCCVVLVLKIKHEERMLTLMHPDYPVRMARVSRLIPLIW